MPFFEPVGSTSDGEGEGTLGKKKPPPVAPKKYRDSQDDKLSDIVSISSLFLHGQIDNVKHWDGLTDVMRVCPCCVSLYYVLPTDGDV